MPNFFEVTVNDTCFKAEDREYGCTVELRPVIGDVRGELWDVSYDGAASERMTIEEIRGLVIGWSDYMLQKMNFLTMELLRLHLNKHYPPVDPIAEQYIELAAR